MSARGLGVALALTGVTLGVTAPAGAAHALDKCVCIMSNKLNTGQTPVKFQYRTCFTNGACGAWKSRSYTASGSAYSAKVICSVSPTFDRFQVRFDWSYAPGFQSKLYNLRRNQSFNVPSDRIASCGCMPAAQYHFVKRASGVEFYSGPARDVATMTCRFNPL